MSLESIRAERLAKLDRLKAAGIDPYPSNPLRTHTIEDFLQKHPELEKAESEVTLAGRITSIREHGSLLFVDIFDGTAKTQAYVEKEGIGEEAFELFTSTIDNGDIVEFSGTAFSTKRGMPSLRATSWRVLAKSLLAMPDEWYGIKDEDERYRKRYLDIFLSKDITERIKRRSLFWNTIRSYLLERDFIEVETPVLETTTGGADARPFVTHHNALDIDVYLRISAGELWQKRLMVAGLPKVFEIGRIFRNEGMSFEHLQDYTQLEYYQAFSDYEEGMEMIMDLYRAVAKKVYGTTVFTIKDQEVDLNKPWERYDYCKLIEKEFNIDPLSASVEDVAKALKDRSISYDPKGFNIERGVDLLWKQIRKTLSGPGFLIGVPAYLEPLAKRSSANPAVVERFQVILAGSEMGKGFSELNDPQDQADRFLHQQELREQGDEEAQMNDDSYVEALEYGMPPAFGFGVSERLFSIFEGVSVREAQIFPLMKPRGE
jgi:lysyl-tRNA synthetase class 2